MKIYTEISLNQVESVPKDYDLESEVCDAIEGALQILEYHEFMGIKIKYDSKENLDSEKKEIQIICLEKAIEVLPMQFKNPLIAMVKKMKGE